MHIIGIRSVRQTQQNHLENCSKKLKYMYNEQTNAHLMTVYYTVSLFMQSPRLHEYFYVT
jgi:hypothetical protein